MINLPTQWWYFFSLVLIVSALFMLIHYLGKIIPKYISGKQRRERFTLLYKRSKLIYLVVVSFYVLTLFIMINLYVHGGLVILLSAIFFPFLRSSLHGIAIQMNELMLVGQVIKTGKRSGQIRKFLPLGVILHNQDGDLFINYLDLHKKGFQINLKEDRSVRSHLVVHSQKSAEEILDLIFETPLVNFHNKPKVVTLENPELKKVYVSLHDGLDKESFIQYLKSHDIIIKQ